MFMVDRGKYGVGILKIVDHKIRLSKRVKDGKILYTINRSYS